MGEGKQALGSIVERLLFVFIYWSPCSWWWSCNAGFKLMLCDECRLFANLPSCNDTHNKSSDTLDI